MSEMQTELREMKSQILELKQLMRTSFDLQLEIQRAIRQEVAAALSSAYVSPSLSSMPPISTGEIIYASLIMMEYFFPSSGSQCYSC